MWHLLRKVYGKSHMYRNHNMNTACVMLSKKLWGQCIPNKLFFINTKDRFLVSLSGE